MPPPGSAAPLSLRLYVLYGVVCTCAGWLLSIVDLLNPAGYALACGLMMAGAVWLVGRTGVRIRKGKLHWRAKHLFPAAFGILAFMALLGGCVYPPSNPDGLTHRVPRLLNWLAEEQWHWIENAPENFNTRATGFEWMMAPLVSLARTDRFVFLLNGWSFLLMPGLVYGVFWRLGVSRRASWHWMWLVPTGYCFLLQAGSIGNDLAGAGVTMAAFFFALRASSTNKLADALYAILAAALMTNAKASNLPLLLPWLILFLPSVPLVLSNPAKLAVTCLLALTISLVPNSAFNIKKVGDWSGATLEAPTLMKLTPAVAFTGNAMNLAAQNFVPPIFPLAGWWNSNAYKVIPSKLRSKLEESFETGGAHITLMEMQLEVMAGLGFGVCVLLVISTLAALKSPGGRAHPSGRGWLAQVARWAAWVALLAYMVKTGLSTSARLIAPYYCLLLPLLLALPGQARVVRAPWWKLAGAVVFVAAAGLLAVNPARPLVPAHAFIKWMANKKPGSGALKKAVLLYESYAARWDALGPIRSHLPPEAQNVGFIPFIASSSIETSLWRPFGQRRIWWLRPGTPRDELNRKNIQYVVIGADSPDFQKWNVNFSEWFEKWLAANNGQIVATELIRLLATGEPKPWHVVRLGPAIQQSVPEPATGKPSEVVE